LPPLNARISAALSLFVDPRGNKKPLAGAVDELRVIYGCWRKARDLAGAAAISAAVFV
jgi:hypothetical protein